MTPERERQLTWIGDGFVLGLVIYCAVSTLIFIF